MPDRCVKRPSVRNYSPSKTPQDCSAPLPSRSVPTANNALTKAAAGSELFSHASSFAWCTYAGFNLRAFVCAPLVEGCFCSSHPTATDARFRGLGGLGSEAPKPACASCSDTLRLFSLAEYRAYYNAAQFCVGKGA